MTRGYKSHKTIELEESGYKDTILDMFFDSGITYMDKFGYSSTQISRYLSQNGVDASPPMIIKAIDDWKKEELDGYPYMKQRIIEMYDDGIDPKDITDWIHERDIDVENDFSGHRISRILCIWRVEYIEKQGLKESILEMSQDGKSPGEIYESLGLDRMMRKRISADDISNAIMAWPKAPVKVARKRKHGDPKTDFNGNGGTVYNGKTSPRLWK